MLMVSQFYPPVAGGQEQHVRNLALALAARGHDVDVITIATGAPAGTGFDGAVRVHRVRTSAQRLLSRLYSDAGRPHTTPVSDPAFRRAVQRLLGSHKFDVVHAHDWSVASAMGPARRAGIPLVLTQHDYGHICATKRLMRGDRVCPGPTPTACLRCSAAQYGPVTGPGVAAANAVVRHSRTRHVGAFIPVSSVVAARTGLAGRSAHAVIPNFVPDGLLVDKAVPRPDGPIVFVGDLSRDKGVDILLDAHRRLGGRPRLLLAGRITDETPSDNLGEQVELLGLLDHDAVIDLMRSACLVTLPSIVPDCCPTVVLEAMALGRPVVAAASGGIVDLVDDGVTGLLVAPGDPAALCTALESVMIDQTNAARMGQMALQRAHSFTASAVVGRVEQVYDGVIAGRTLPA